MRILHGVDLVEVRSVANLLADEDQHFVRRCFLPKEVGDAGKGMNMPAKLATRFAAKESVMKALGTGFSGGIGFLDIEVQTAQSGAPSIVLHRKAAKVADAIGVSSWAVSMSHDGDYAIASVIAVVEASSTT